MWRPFPERISLGSPPGFFLGKPLTEPLQFKVLSGNTSRGRTPHRFLLFSWFFDFGECVGEVDDEVRTHDWIPFGWTLIVNIDCCPNVRAFNVFNRRGQGPVVIGTEGGLQVRTLVRNL